MDWRHQMGNLIAKTRAMLTRLDTDEVVDPVLLLSPIELTTVLQTDRLDKREVCVGRSRGGWGSAEGWG